MIKNIVITGTSGLGKTYLEEQLEKLGLTYQLPKITNRPPRPNENSQKTICLPQDQFDQIKKDFFFSLSYNGFDYGWKFDGNSKPITLAITLDSLASFLQTNPNFLPILLTISPANFNLLEQRMLSRGDSPQKVSERLQLALTETKNIQKYLDIVNQHYGLIFEITSDNTIPQIIIPQITTLFS